MQDIIIFGHGRYYKSKVEEINRKYRVIAFLDNIVKEGGFFTDENGINIYNPSKVMELPMVPIIIMSVKFYEMWQELISIGVKAERIMFGFALRPYYDEIEILFYEQGVKLYSDNSRLMLKNKEGMTYHLSSEAEYKKIVRVLQRQRDTTIEKIALMPTRPISRRCGYERGMPIDRYYIEKFINANKSYIHGTVMEVADNQYTKKFINGVKKSLVMHVNGWGKNVVQVNLETGDGVQEYINSIDCFICTQTVQMIYDMKAAVQSIYQMLKPGGVALITIAGIAGLSLYDYYNWGEYWRVTPKALQMIMEDVFSRDKIKVINYGNVKTTIAFLYGLCVEDLNQKDFIYDDEQFSMLICCCVQK